METGPKGCIAALVPAFEEELVENRKWIDKESFNEAVVVASVSPASLSMSIAAVWNNSWSFISSYSYAIPGPLIFLILLTGFSFIGDAGLKYIQYASVGIIAFVLLLLYNAN